MHRVGTIGDTFACCFDMFILGHTLLPLHDDISSYMYTYGPSHPKRFGIGVWDILHIQPGFFIQHSAFRACPGSNSSILINPARVYTGEYPMHCYVRMFKRMVVFGDAFS